MRTLSLCVISTLLLAGSLAESGKDPHSGGYPPKDPKGGYGGGYGPTYDYADLAQLDKFIDITEAEKAQLDKRVKMVKMQKANLLKSLDKIIYKTIPHFMAVQDDQDSSLQTSEGKIKKLLHIVGILESILAGEKVVTEKVNDLMVERWSRIHELTKNNQQQDALLDKAEFFLNAAATKLHEKLKAMKEDGLGQITELKYNTKALGDVIDFRQCQSTVAAVEIDPATGKGEYYVPVTVEDVPTVFCAICGFTSTLYLDGKTYGYGYPDTYQKSAVTVDCKAFPDKVQVSVFDGSEGSGNSVDGVYVAVKACSQASSPNH
ncbi:uncharacterized protein LOC143291153 [Babylonia areolata]|uniref:uncharacterized protein LOC143291153 n=1 Tax=Babylonia areolata TaxID=304850 RepID=UPI003FCF3AEA